MEEVDASSVWKVQCRFLSFGFLIILLQHEVARDLRPAIIDIVQMAQTFTVKTSAALDLSGRCSSSP